jgi:hypothetical protein
MLGSVIDGELLVGGDRGIDAFHALRNPKKVHEMLRPAHERWTRRMRDRLSEWIQTPVLDEVETGVMRQIAVIEDKTNETVWRPKNILIGGSAGVSTARH